MANPAEILARLIAATEGRAGHVTVPGFYDDVRPLSERERPRSPRLPFDEAAYKQRVGVAGAVGRGGYERARTDLDATDAGGLRALGRLPGAGRQDGNPGSRLGQAELSTGAGRIQTE